MAEPLKYVEFEGPCPFVMCFADGKHRHPVCPKCGAVGFGNLYCEECQRNVDMQREITKIQWGKR